MDVISLAFTIPKERGCEKGILAMVVLFHQHHIRPLILAHARPPHSPFGVGAFCNRLRFLSFLCQATTHRADIRAVLPVMALAA